MTMPSSFRDRDQDKFIECNGRTAVRTKICQEQGEAIKVEVVDDGDGGQVQNFYNEVSSVSQSSPTNIINYTVPIGASLFLKIIDCSGENVATYSVLVDDIVIRKRRSWWTAFNIEFIMQNLLLTEGQNLKIQVEHNRPSLSDFNASFTGNIT